MAVSKRNSDQNADLIYHVHRIIRESYESNIGPECPAFGRSTNLQQHLEFDSLHKTNLVLELEEHFKVTMLDSDADSFVTVANVEAAVDVALAKVGR